MPLSIKWHEQLHGFTSFPSPATPIFNTRKKVEVIRVLAKAANLGSESNAKKANLCAAKKERIKLPSFDGSLGRKNFHIREFLSHPSGTEAMLNTRALENFEPLSTDTYRCTLPKLKLLNFEAAPVVDLRVNPTNEDCMVEMLSCKFEGSESVERQNSRFSALMTNHMSWGTDDSESFLEVDVKLNLTLEIYTRPFTMMPVSAVERPGNLMMQALLDRLVPLLLQQLLQDYDKWVHKQSEDDLP
ncbi:hypothetical protein RchiOBHm_Chr4g0410411 [Rosa chinensis]|uniref:DUF1997 family protein n=2 Tax=Rosa chinensis TaxID=74649 RepID=A0A2P6QVC1_ROSCH|nr:uncharacterized protein LOC112197419 isoform X1 [Rosa chinensis]XP_024193843.1 uncharacterized protein LOC112197419 isoform X1 [Rosa chinensis]PRQ38133.1 hypothetical protein RchiOBHm_Chr4g0410411 [Rosa chinensis]